LTQEEQLFYNRTMENPMSNNLSRYCPEVEDASLCDSSELTVNENCPPQISHVTSGKGVVRLLKTVLSSACENNCNYCAFRLGRDGKRNTLQPDEMAKQFMGLWQAGLLDGFFLSSGICGGGVRTQDKILDTAEILRKKMGYFGYLHLKIMPGSEFDQVKRAMQLADRVSINLEAPVDHVLHTLAPQKPAVKDLLKRIQWINSIRQTMDPAQGWKGHWPSSTTQFVVGAGGETDLELLTMGLKLHRKMMVQRIYYSGFTPIENTPFDGLLAASKIRVLRLYQSDFLLRDYGFELEELPINQYGILDETQDPKIWWADQHYRQQPIEINRAEFGELMRIPGIGAKTARRVLEQRIKNTMKDIGSLRRAGVPVDKVLPYILVNGKRIEHNPSLFGSTITIDENAPIY
jgi:predicted DNA-binding helix-hairpin-helix protein